jgi:putative aldouronate transport system permease protein
MKRRGFRTSPSDVWFLVIKNIFLIFWFVIVLYPVVYIVSASFSDPQSVIAGKVWLFPVKPTLQGYIAVLKDSNIALGFKNSFIYMFLGTALNLVMTLLAAYPLSRRELKGKGILTAFFVFTMLFNGGLVPTYLVVKDLGLINKVWAMIIPVAMSVYNVIITRTYLQTTIPQELYEAAEIDGCSDIRAMVMIALPLSGPILAVMALYYGVGHWNSYFNALIYLNSQDMLPLQLVLRRILVQNTITQEMKANFMAEAAQQSLIDILKYSVIVVSSIPVICLYPFVEKFFKKGVMIGALKG